jgi:hypothetical protein
MAVSSSTKDTSAVINSSSFEFFVRLTKENHFTPSGSLRVNARTAVPLSLHTLGTATRKGEVGVYPKGVQRYNVYGSHCDGDDDKKIYQTLNTAEEVADLIHQHISTACQFFIVQNDDKIFGGKSTFDVVFHQTFSCLDEVGNLGTTLTTCVDSLRNY